MQPIPTTKSLAASNRSHLEAAFGTVSAILPKAAVDVVAKMHAGSLMLVYKYASGIQLNLIPSLASTRSTTIGNRTFIPAETWGELIGAGRMKVATQAVHTIDITVKTQVGSLKAGTQLIRLQTGFVYTLDADVPLDAPTKPASVTAVSDPNGNGGAGRDGNLQNGDVITFANPPVTIARDAVVTGQTVEAAGDEATFNGATYTCVQAHASQVGWEPPNVPALWQEVAGGDGDGDDSCDAGECCPTGTVLVLLTDGPDTSTVQQPDRCIVAKSGDDTIQYAAATGRVAVAGGNGRDTIMAGADADHLSGGPGDDILYGYDGADFLSGNAGDDTIFAGNGDNHVYPGPGPGRDTVATGTGDDHIYFHHECELTSGKTIDAGTGHDVIHSPVPEDELANLGVNIANVEEVVATQSACSPDCADPCSGNGICIESATGQMECACEDGFTGEDCDTPEEFEVEELGLDELLPPGGSGVTEISSFMILAAQGGADTGQRDALLALPGAVVHDRLQEALDRSELPIDRFAIVYTALIRNDAALLSLFERVIQFPVPADLLTTDPHSRRASAESGAVALATLGAFRLYQSGVAAARNILLVAAAHDWRAVRGRVAFFAGQHGEQALIDNIRAALPTADEGLLLQRVGVPTDFQYQITGPAIEEPTNEPALVRTGVIVK